MASFMGVGKESLIALHCRFLQSFTFSHSTVQRGVSQSRSMPLLLHLGDPSAAPDLKPKHRPR